VSPLLALRVHTWVTRMRIEVLLMGRGAGLGGGKAGDVDPVLRNAIGEPARQLAAWVHLGVVGVSPRPLA
jgi:hypothetical protein